MSGRSLGEAAWNTAAPPVRILVVDTIYPAFYERHYARQPELRTVPYAAQLRSLWDECFGTSDAYVRHLRELGHDADGLIANCIPLQVSWLRERRVPAALTRVATSLPTRPGLGVRQLVEQLTLLAQIEHFRPDVLFVHDLWMVSPWLLDVVRRRVPRLVGQIASAPPPVERFRRFDLMLSSFPHFVERFRSAGIDAELFRLGYYDHISQRLADEGVSVEPDAPGRAGVALVGGLSPQVYPSVTPALERLCDEVDVDVWGYGEQALTPGSPILRRFHGEAWGLDMYRILARARVVINRHGDIAAGYANNMRLFEATGVGAVLVTEAAPNLDEMFAADREVVTFEDGEQLAGRVKNLLADEDAAVRIARGGQARTMREHTYADRMRELSEMLARRSPRSLRRRYQSM